MLDDARGFITCHDGRTSQTQLPFLPDGQGLAGDDVDDLRLDVVVDAAGGAYVGALVPVDHQGYGPSLC